MNEAIVTAGDDGLRVAIAPGRDWAIAAVPDVRLPTNTGAIRVRVRALEGGGRWLMRLYGDLRGTGTHGSLGAFEGMTSRGTKTLILDPRLLRLAHRPLLQVQLGLEGPPGAAVLFQSLEFLPGPRRRPTPAIPGQRTLEAVALMPNHPHPFRLLDWRAVAHGFDRLAFDFAARGEHLPLIWLDDSRVNSDQPAFGLFSYVGDTRQGGSNHEAITGMGAVLGATIAGIDKRRQAHDYVRLCEAYYNTRNGSHLVLNRMDAETGHSFWYEIWPHILFYALTDRYPGTGRMEAILRATADRWAEACRVMRGDGDVPDLDHTAFDFQRMRPVDNGRWKEPDAAAGIAWLEYVAWTRTGNPEYLAAAEGCLRFLERRRPNPYYEVLLPWGALTAARANAELGRRYDLHKLLNWCFGVSDCRGGWGVTVGRWGRYDCHGLVGSIDNRGGYAFAMNTFAQAGALVPLVRYDARYARAIGKWMLHLATAARLFYPKELPADHQSSAFWQGDPEGVIAYEGLRREWNGKSPVAMGDPLAMQWGPKTDLSLYGSALAGFLGGIVRRTNHPQILALDCLATDFFPGAYGEAPTKRAYPTTLYYNPYRTARQVAITVGPAPCDLYDAVTHRFLRRGVQGTTYFRLLPDRAAVVVAVPAGGAVTHEGQRLRVAGVVIDFQAGSE
ncbi:MAG: hypothetical protein GX774_00090 [Armatimonadetes bacterium]|nr:hypothetical protein [Armatimonadota bacterium]